MRRDTGIWEQNTMDICPLRGREVLSSLAETYPQLYLAPGGRSPEIYKKIVQYGQDAPSHSLAHFSGCEDDVLELEVTPTGAVPVITLCDRGDFERFLQLMAFRAEAVPVPRTQGAAILDGVINWRKIRAHEKEFRAANGPQADWESEFVRFTSDRANFKDALILLSRGPYSAVPASALGLDEDAWLALSHVIRKAHECTHFICRRLFPDKKDAVWDELTADAVGIRAAFGRYDAALAERFLGISQSGYTGGRLENYMSGEEDRQERLNALADKIRVTLRHLEKIIADAGDMGPYDLAIRLEEEFECWKQP